MPAGTPPGAPAGVGWSASSLRAQRRTLARRERRVQSRAGQARVASSAGAPESRLRGRSFPNAGGPGLGGDPECA